MTLQQIFAKLFADTLHFFNQTSVVMLILGFAIALPVFISLYPHRTEETPSSSNKTP